MFGVSVRCTLLLLLQLLLVVIPNAKIPHHAHVKGIEHKRGGNYHWATKLLGSNDKNSDNPDNVNLVFEIGSRDLLDGNFLAYFYGATVYSFEASPFNYETMENNHYDEKVHIVRSAVSKHDGTISFFAVNKTVYSNTGVGSLHKADYVTNRNPGDPDYNLTGVQVKVTANSTRLDTFIKSVSGRPPDMICLDCQESELEALESAGEYLREVKYIVFEAATVPGYTNGNSFKDVHLYLDQMGFRFVALKRLSGRGNLMRFELPSNFIVDHNDTADFVYVNNKLKWK